MAKRTGLALYARRSNHEQYSVHEFQLKCWRYAVQYLYDNKDTVITLSSPEYYGILFNQFKIHSSNNIATLSISYKVSETENARLSPSLLSDFLAFKSANDLMSVIYYLVNRHFSDTPEEIAQTFHSTFTLNISAFSVLPTRLY